MKTGEINIHDSNRPRKRVDEFDLGMDLYQVRQFHNRSHPKQPK